MPYRDLIPPRKNIINLLPGFVARYANIGVENYKGSVKRRLQLTNLTALLITIASLSYVLLYAVYDFNTYSQIVYANIFLTIGAFCAPWFHRISDIAAGIFIAVIEYSMLSYLIALLGRDAGIQINFIIGAALPFVAFDLKRIRVILALVGLGLILNIACWYAFPPAKAQIMADQFLLVNVYLFSVVTTFCIIAVIVHRAFRLVNDAQAQTDALLHNILPSSIVERLNKKPNDAIADSYENASVLFADLAGFTPMAARLGARKTVAMLNEIFIEFDQLAAAFGIEKIKTIGDAYMAVCGVPVREDNHKYQMVQFALEMQNALEEIATHYNVDLTLRIGIAAGPIMAGVIGTHKFSYDVWGDTVNRAARLESHGELGEIHVEQGFLHNNTALRALVEVEPRGEIEIKGIGLVETCFLRSTNKDESKQKGERA